MSPIKARILAATIYLGSAVLIWQRLDTNYGADGVIQGLTLLHLATAGVLALITAAVFSLFSLRLGAICAAIGCALVWPYMIYNFRWFPWSLGYYSPEMMPFEMIATILANSYITFLTLVLVSVYSAGQLRSHLSGRSAFRHP